MFRLNRVALRHPSAAFSSSTAGRSASSKVAAALGSTTALVAATVVGATGFVYASDDVLHPPTYDFKHKGYLTSFDHAALRRGFQGKFSLIPIHPKQCRC